jgi:molybdopterin molybdotransferase
MRQNAIPLQSAIEELLHQTSTPERHEKLPLLASLGRISFEDIHARIDIPPFDNSPLDGFAIAHRDLVGASQDKPAVLRVIETLYAGDASTKPLEKGACVRVMTGAPIPAGATCVIRYEDTDNGQDYVRVPLSLGEHKNYRFRGEDLKKGQEILRRGERITVAAIGVLAGQGFVETSVFARPKVGILSTGSELISGDQPLKPGKIYDSNHFALGAKVLALGAEPVFGPPAADDPQTIAKTLGALLETCDFMVTTGGVSVGDRDYMPLVGKLIQAKQLFRGVHMKPGGWITGLCKGSTLVLCLSGNPRAAALSFDLLAAPVIRRLAGIPQTLPQRMACLLKDPFPKASDTRRFLYARQEQGAVSLGPSKQVSGSLSSFMDYNCILDIPPGTPPLSAGDRVEVILL